MVPFSTKSIALLKYLWVYKTYRGAKEQKLKSNIFQDILKDGSG